MALTARPMIRGMELKPASATYQELGRALARALGEDITVDSVVAGLEGAGAAKRGVHAVEWAYIGVLEVVLVELTRLRTHRDDMFNERMRDTHQWATLRAIASAARRWAYDDEFHSDDLRALVNEHLKVGVPGGYDAPFSPREERVQAVARAAVAWGAAATSAETTGALLAAVQYLQPGDLP